jgi:hypothetical protein
MKIEKVNNYKCKPIITTNSYKFPTNKISGTTDFYLGGVYGVRGGGKSTLILNLLDIEEHLVSGENITYIISPTKDSKFSYYIDNKYKDNIVYYDELTIDILDKVFNAIKSRIDDWNFKKKMLEEAEDLEDNDYELYEDYNINHPPISTLIIDDSINSTIFTHNSKDSKKFMKYYLRHRHLYTHIFVLSQTSKGIPKSYRTNSNFIIMFPFRDSNVYKGIFDEYSILFQNDFNKFLSVMDKIEMRGNHSFLLIFFDSVKYVSINFNERILF